ncbi:hypothetical protein K439DRAFT_1562614 [Ramaria rubella]|nr:hypothetical protein K439DRAFT_1562614 [Ramaria rubella]
MPTHGTHGTQGLVYPADFLASLPVLLPRPAPHAPIRALTAQQFAKIRHLHLTSDVPDSVLFPFLHGLEGDNHAQNTFFAKHGTSVVVPDYRGLIWVVCDDDDVLPIDKPSRDHDELDLDDVDDDDSGVELRAESAAVDIGSAAAAHDRRQSDASSLSSSVESIFSQSMSISTAATSLHSPNPSASCASLASPCNPKPSTSHLLTSTFHPSDLLTTSLDGPAFIPPVVPKGISLRNFGIQVPIYATLSDIVIYSPKGLTRAAFALAERFKLAIETKAHERGMMYGARTASPNSTSPPPSPLSSASSPSSPVSLSSSAPEPLHVAYNVFIITDPFSTFEHDLPDLVGVTSTGVPVNHISFPEREMQEMQDLTHATEMLPGVCIGNSADVPLWEKGDPEAPFDASCNPNGYDICIECHDMAPFPHSALLKQAEDHLTALDALWSTGYGGPISPSFFGATAAAPPRPPPNANTIIHFSFPSAPPATQSTMAFLTPFLSFLQSVLHRPRRCKVLIYSHDGYTESSVLALSLVMAEKRCSLPEAYLELQVARGRSFFVHQYDLGVLKRVEAKYSRVTDKEKQREAERAGRERWGWSTLMGRSGTLSFGSSSAASAASSVSSSSNSNGQLSSSIPTPSHNETPHRRARAQTSPLLPALVDHQSWFNDERFDGSFPSRVLPFLYLGNLNHASNAYMLHALGITHVVSVGECALVPPLGGDGFPAPEYQVVLGKQSGIPGSLWREEREGRIKVLDIKGVCDDGIDSLRTAFASICAWIDRARVEGGQVLVHCRVGVSRSATVTIAYVMKHLHLSLVDAYLIVRSRRLSVLIQPNMRLLYNLCGWEVELARQRVGDDEEALRQALKKSLNWPYLAREVHLLNEKYLH